MRFTVETAGFCAGILRFRELSRDSGASALPPVFSGAESTGVPFANLTFLAEGFTIFVLLYGDSDLTTLLAFGDSDRTVGDFQRAGDLEASFLRTPEDVGTRGFVLTRTFLSPPSPGVAAGDLLNR